MKNLFVIVAVMVLLVQAVVAEDCIRQDTTKVKVKVNNWCNNKLADAVLSNSVGYCTNVKCKSSHRTHHNTVILGKNACMA